MWIIHVTPPPDGRDPSLPGWYFRPGFFPREVRYLTMAKELAVDARRRGGTDVRVEKVVGRRVERPKQQDPEGRAYQAGYASASGYPE